MKFLSEPLVQFLLLGGLIYFAYAVVTPQTKEDASQSIVVSASKLQWMQNTWEKRWNRLPTQRELDGLIEQYVKERVLYNEAIKMGLDKDDAVIRRKLAQKVEFLAKDLVVYTPATDEDLKTYYDAHKKKYMPDATYTFIQIFFNPDKRGKATLQDAKDTKELLLKQSTLPQDLTVYGDRSMLISYLENKSAFNIEKSFGKKFTEELSKLEAGKWQGTILSGYGVHLVYIKEIIRPPMPTLSQIKETVLQDWTSDKQKEINKQFYTALKANYTIVIEDENVSVLNPVPNKAN